MNAIRGITASVTGRCKHCLKKLTVKEKYLFNWYCTECWRLRGGD